MALTLNSISGSCAEFSSGTRPIRASSLETAQMSVRRMSARLIHSVKTSKITRIQEAVVILTTDLYVVYQLKEAGLLNREEFWTDVFSTNGIFDPSKISSPAPTGDEVIKLEAHFCTHGEDCQRSRERMFCRGKIDCFFRIVE